jgi:hypothetical protein
MDAGWAEWKPSRRDELITLARYGKVTPDQAEAEAAASGWEPFARQPELTAFDPMLESRWAIVMAIAWIAWRDIRLVQQNCPDCRSQCRLWVFREWNEPVSNGTAFERRAGWFLESWSEATTVRLMIHERFLAARNELPPSRQMSVSDAEKALWRALSDGHLVAEAQNDDGKPMDIPQREWSYVKLFEDGKRDALKYDPLDRREAFHNIRLKRDDLLRLWPAPEQRVPRVETTTWPLEPHMIKPVSDAGEAGYVPLCAALLWIMSDAGARSVMIVDQEAWEGAVNELWPLICSGDIELNGLPRGGGLTVQIPAHQLTLVKVLPPLHDALADVLLSAPSHIVSTPYVDQEHWSHGFNDRLYITGQPTPAWTHLQLPKTELLRRWPRPAPTAKAQQGCYFWLLEQMKAAPQSKPKSKAAFWIESKARFSRISRRQFDRMWEKSITDSEAHGWSKAGRLARKSNRRTK